MENTLQNAVQTNYKLCRLNADQTDNTDQADQMKINMIIQS